MQTGLQNNLPIALVTGGSGFLGRWLTPRLTRDHAVWLLRRPASAHSDDALRAWVHTHGGDASRLRFVDYDLADPRAALPPDASDARLAFHLGARFAWGLSPDDAIRTNVDGTVRLAAALARLPRLARLVSVSGYRVALPLAPGQSEADLGAYEASKRAAHTALLAWGDRLPLTVLNPASLSGDQQTGETVQHIGVPELFRLLAQRRLPLVPGTPRTFLPLAPVDFVADFALRAATAPEAEGQQYTLLDERGPLLPELMARAAAHYGVPAPWGTIHPRFLRWLPAWLIGAPKETLAFVAEDRYDTSNSSAAARSWGLSWPDITESLPRWLDALRSRRLTGVTA